MASAASASLRVNIRECAAHAPVPINQMPEGVHVSGSARANSGGVVHRVWIYYPESGWIIREAVCVGFGPMSR